MDRVDTRLPPTHGLQGITTRNRSLTVRRSNADIESNKAVSSYCTGKHIGRTKVRRSRKKTKSLGFGMGISTTSKSKKAIASLVVASGGRPGRTT